MNRSPSYRRWLIAGSMAAVCIGGAVWLLVDWRNAMPAKPSTAAASVSSTTRTPLYWYDPMVPAQRFSQAGKSPFMDMQLVPKYADDAPADSVAGNSVVSDGTRDGRIAIDPRVVQSLGIRLVRVGQGRFSQSVDATGLIAVDEHRIEAVVVRAAGWVEQLNVRAVGDAVTRGQLLAGVFAPDLLAAQQELLLARRSNDAELAAAARQRLALFGLGATQIAEVEKSGRSQRRVNYFAPMSGYVMALGARVGSAVAADTVLFQLADLQRVWLTAEVPETQAAWLKVGDVVSAEVPAFPGQRFSGRIDYLYPEFSATTRTLKVRVTLANEANQGQQLRPGMFASVHFNGVTREAVLTVPTEAVIKTGNRSVVIVALDTAHFQPVLVQVGAEQGGQSEVLSGLVAGQKVVASGQFLIDSEANLRGALAQLTDAPGTAP